MSWRWFAFLLLAFMSVLLPGSAQASTPPVWGEPTQLGPELPSSWFPDIDADPTGTVRLVWSSSLIEGDANKSHEIAGGIMISELTADGWSEPSDIFVMDGGIASRPMIASDGAYAHLIFRYAPPGVPVRIFYSRAPLGADLSNTHSWSKMRQISNDESYWTQLRVLPSGDLVIIYNQVASTPATVEAPRQTVLYVRRSTDRGETWSAPTRISNGTENVARTSLAVSPNGRVLLADWDIGYDNMAASGEPGGFATSVSTDGGLTWSEPLTRTGDYEQSAVATDGTRALLVYRSTTEDQLYYQLSDDGGQTWSEQRGIEGGIARPYPNKHNFDKLSLAIDGGGRFLLSWVGTNADAPDGLSVMVATWADGEWTAPQIVASPEGYPEYPRLTVSLGNDVYLAYFVRDNEFDLGHYTMWVARGTSDASAIAPARTTPAPAVLSPQRIIPTPDLFARPTQQAEPTPVSGAIVVDRTPQAINAQPLRSIATFTAGSIVIVLITIGAARWLLHL